MAVARRIYLHVMAFAALMAVLSAMAGLLRLLLSLTLLRALTVLSAADTRSSSSLYLAALIVGLPVWLIHWIAASRLAASSPQEADSAPRRLYLAAVFGVASVVALFALAGVLQLLFALPFASDSTTLTDSAMASLSRLVVFGIAWAASVRPTLRVGIRRRDQAMDLAVYILAGCALGLLWTGAFQAISQTARDLLQLVVPGGAVLLSNQSSPIWRIWSRIAAWIVAGGGVWVAVWSHDLRRDLLDRPADRAAGPPPLRIVYLSLVLLVAVPATLEGGTFLLFELLRHLLGYVDTNGPWSLAPSSLGWLVVGAVVWAYHWHVIRRQRPPTGLEGELAPSEPAVPNGIVWPRRPYLAVLSFVGIASAAPALVSLLWLALDFWFGRNPGLTGSGWWRDRLSFGLAAALVGSVVWLGAWTLLQRAANTDPVRERTAAARRVLLGAIILVAALSALGLVIALLWLVLRFVLGDTVNADSLSMGLKEVSGAIISVLIALCHADVMRHDAATAPAPRRPLRLLTFVASDAHDVLRRLRAQEGLEIDVIGRLRDGSEGGAVPDGSLDEALAALSATGDERLAVLILHRDGSSLYPINPA